MRQVCYEDEVDGTTVPAPALLIRTSVSDEQTPRCCNLYSRKSACESVQAQADCFRDEMDVGFTCTYMPDPTIELSLENKKKCKFRRLSEMLEIFVHDHGQSTGNGELFRVEFGFWNC